MNNLSKFLDFLAFEKRFSSHTLKSYETDLRQFSGFLAEQYQLENPAEANHFIIRSWIVELLEKQVDPRSVARKLTTIRTYYRYMVRTGEIQRSPMLKVVAPKVSKKLPEFIDQTRMEQLTEMEIPEDDFTAYRNWFLVDFFYRTGVRRAELIGLKVEDINMAGMVINVTGKRNKQRQIPISHDFKNEILHYLEMRRKFMEEKGTSTTSFFIGNSGNQITVAFVYRIVKAAVSLVSTGSKRSPHILRHSFATAMLNNGADINSIKELLGHSSLAATQIYTHNSIEKLREVYRRAFPKA